MTRRRTHCGGFTIIEVLIALVVASIVMGAGYAAYRAHLRSYLTQEQIVDMQQNIRAAMYYISTDMRLAGYGLAGNVDHLGFTNALSNTVTLEMDLDGDNDVTGSEQVVYALDANGNLTRNGDILARNIEVLDLVYLTDDEDGNGRGDVLPDVVAPLGEPDEPDKIRSVEVTLVARAGDKELELTQQFTDTKIYYNQQGTVILDKSGTDAQDDFRRRLFSSVFKCRNMGLPEE